MRTYIKVFALLAIGLCLFVEAHKDPLTAEGRTVMIHLFEWKWTE